MGDFAIHVATLEWSFNIFAFVLSTQLGLSRISDSPSRATFSNSLQVFFLDIQLFEMAEDGHKVSLNVYDLSQGLARQLSTTFLGKAIEGIWHTGVVVYGNEYYFGGGIQHSPIGTTPYGNPIRSVDLGFTHVPKELFEEYLQEISPRYTAETYSLLKHNCNNFSNEVAQFLVGTDIPDYILQLPNEVLNSPMGPLILPMIQQLETTLRAGAVPQAPQFRPTSLTQPPPFMSTAVNATSNSNTTLSREIQTSKAEIPHQSNSGPGKASEKVRDSVDKTATATEYTEGTPKKVVAGDPLGNARTKIQEEISREFAAIMASGTVRASEAATMATRKVMERYGQLNGAVKQN
ncbi:Desumoylating isopeptidase [Thalictrum thalictroides]|uniref:Desumoylating isopeptidase n=1 Tax=Thalictrum thalictroides TaxID=46969 RepID=A0A7J6V3B6_THATH|nr:Desumoylating isopeptidase [Thalictrum thalictroides]